MTQDLWEVGEVRKGWKLEHLSQRIVNGGVQGTGFFSPEADEEEE